MQCTHLGRSGPSVSRLCLGAMNFGPQTDPPAAHSIMDFAQEAGINLFDTANRVDGTFPGHQTAPEDYAW
jgi:aryl-alcohol dehydrogenase-like predicted oxidoreductase